MKLKKKYNHIEINFFLNQAWKNFEKSFEKKFTDEKFLKNRLLEIKRNINQSSQIDVLYPFQVFVLKKKISFIVFQKIVGKKPKVTFFKKRLESKVKLKIFHRRSFLVE